MGIFKGLFKPKAQTDNLDEIVSRVSEKLEEKSANWGQLFSAGKSMGLFDGDDVSNPYQTVASVYKAVKAIADNIPQARPIFISIKDDQEVKDPKLELRFRQPNSKQSYNDFIQECAGYYALYGECFILKSVENIGEAAGIRLPQLISLNPAYMHERVNETTKQIDGWTFNQRSYPVEEIIHIKDFNPYNAYRGLSPLSPIKRELGIDKNTLVFNEAYFKNDATPNFLLTTEGALSPVQRKMIDDWWQKNFGGVKKKFKMATLEGGLKAQILSQTHADMEFIEQKKLMREEILGTWRAPKALFNITEDLNYATFIGQMKIFWIYTLLPILRKFEDGLNMHYIQNIRQDIKLVFDIKNVPAFAEDFKDKVTTAETLSRIGFTGNELNEKLDLGFEDKPWRDEWWVGLGQTPASDTLDTIDNPEPEESPQDMLPPADSANDGKAVRKARVSLYKQRVLKAFLSRHANVEGIFSGKMKKHFFELRRDILSSSDEVLSSGNTQVDWVKQDDKLKTKISPVVKMAIEQGVAQGEMLLGKKKDVASDELMSRIASGVNVRADKITGINKTIRKQVDEKIKKVIEEGVLAGQTMNQIADSVRSVVRDIFNNAGVRAKLIARTETTGAMNEGQLAYYDSEGVEKKQWLTAHDEFVRDSHSRCEDQGAIDSDVAFQNGLRYPADQSTNDAGEICNCRCTLLPILD